MVCGVSCQNVLSCLATTAMSSHVMPRCIVTLFPGLLCHVFVRHALKTFRAMSYLACVAMFSSLARYTIPIVSMLCHAHCCHVMSCPLLSCHFIVAIRSVVMAYQAQVRQSIPYRVGSVMFNIVGPCPVRLCHFFMFYHAMPSSVVSCHAMLYR